MSNRRTPMAVLEGHVGPWVLPEIAAVHLNLYRNNFVPDRARILEAVSSAQGYVGHCVPVTGDEYTWLIGLEFELNPVSKVVVAIPFACDWSHEHQTQSDRMIACYSKGGVIQADLIALLVRLNRHLVGIRQLAVA